MVHCVLKVQKNVHDEYSFEFIFQGMPDILLFFQVLLLLSIFEDVIQK